MRQRPTLVFCLHHGVLSACRANQGRESSHPCCCHCPSDPCMVFLCMRFCRNDEQQAKQRPLLRSGCKDLVGCPCLQHWWHLCRRRRAAAERCLVQRQRTVCIVIALINYQPIACFPTSISGLQSSLALCPARRYITPGKGPSARWWIWGREVTERAVQQTVHDCACGLLVIQHTFGVGRAFMLHSSNTPSNPIRWLTTM